VLALALAITIAVQQDTTLDVATYTSREWGVSMPRPFNDWIFAPATARGTTTVIFQPRSGALSEQLWGALVMSSWGRPVPLGEVADRRITTTWRSTLGPTFQLLTRDSLEIAGLPAIHLVMSGAINLAVVDVEEYLLARDSELVALQFRYPRGLPRDSIGAGYRRSLAGLRVRTPARVVARRQASSPPWDVGIEGDVLFFDLPEAYRAIAPGRLSSEVVAQGRRLMRWSPFYGMPDTSLYSVGHYQLESRIAGRLTVKLWRNQSTDTAVTHVTDDMIAQVADAWGTYWRDFGPVPTAEVTLVETPWRETQGGPAALFVGADLRTPAGSFIVRRELARSWWGGVVRATGPAAWLISELLPAWSASLIPGATVDTSATALEATRQIAGDARFREAIRTFLAESRDSPPAVEPFMTLLGDSAASSIRALMRGQAR
jgi:hypothetical protein